MASTLAWDIIARDRASKAFEHVGRSVESVGHKVEHTGHSFGILKTGAKIGVAALGAMTLGAGLLVEKTIDFVKAAADDQHAQVLLAATARNTTGANKEQIASMEEWIAAQGKAKGVMLNELRPAMGKLLTVTHSVGKAQHLASLAMDVSAGSGKTLESITLALVKAQNGSLGGLSRLGVATKDAAGNTLSLQQVTKALAKTYRGDAAKAAGTATGQMDRLKVAFEEGKVALGDKLLPALGKFSGWMLDKAVPATQKFASNLGKQLGPAVRAVGKWISGTLVPAIIKVAHWFKAELIPQAMKLARAVLPQLKSTLTSVGKALHSAGPWFHAFGMAMKGVWNITKTLLIPIFIFFIKNGLRTLGVAFKAAGFIMGAFGKGVIVLWNNYLAPFFRFIMRGVAGVLRTWASMLKLLSHVPGFGWASDAATKLSHAADQAGRFGQGIKNIPTSHTVTITTHYVVTHSGGTTHSSAGGHTAAGSASGGYIRGGRPRLVGEHGPEIFVPSSGGQVIPHSRTSAAMASSGGDQDLHVHLYLDGKEIQTSLLKRKRVVGGQLGLA